MDINYLRHKIIIEFVVNAKKMSMIFTLDVMIVIITYVYLVNPLSIQYHKNLKFSQLMKDPNMFLRRYLVNLLSIQHHKNLKFSQLIKDQNIYLNRQKIKIAIQMKIKDISWVMKKN
jgi:hypothetical protein